MPISLRMTLEAAMISGLPAVGIGGVSTAEDVIQYIMAGATLVGVCTAGHLKGPGAYTNIIKKIEHLAGELGYTDLEQMRGLTIRRIEERKEQGKTAVTVPVVPEIIDENCTSCKKCEAVCVYEAISAPDKQPARINADACIGCGLCVSVCPTRAIVQRYY